MIWIWKILYGLLLVSNYIIFTAIVFFDFMPSPHAVAAAAFFAAGTGCLAMLNQD